MPIKLKPSPLTCMPVHSDISDLWFLKYIQTLSGVIAPKIIFHYRPLFNTLLILSLDGDKQFSKNSCIIETPPMEY